MSQADNLAEQAFASLYPDRDVHRYSLSVKYSKAFKGYNANVKYKPMFKEYVFKLDYKWKSVDPEIQMGLIAYLMKKCFNFEAQETHHIDLYESFMRNVHKTVEKKVEDQVLLDSFTRMNEKYFDGIMDISSLRWGQLSTRQLGLYEYGNDTITISSIFNRDEIDYWLLDFIMYHEMLHKKHKFYKTDTGRNMHHTPAFRRDEKKYERFDAIEDALGHYIRGWKISQGRRQAKLKRRTNTLLNFFR